MAILKMALCTAAPIAASVLLYLLDKKTKFGNLGHKAKQIIIGIIFGGVAMTGTWFGMYVNGYTINTRDAAPLCAGLIFGAPAGIIAGCIGGIDRWFAALWGMGMLTRVACSVSTVLAGFIGAALRKFVFDNKKPSWFYAFAVGLVTETFHMLMVFLTNMNDVRTAFSIVQNASHIMIICNSISVMISVLIISMLSKEKITGGKGETKQIIQTFQKWLLVCVIVAYAATSLFTFVLQTNLAKSDSDRLLSVNIGDVRKDIEDMSDEKLLSVTKDVVKDMGNSEITNELLSDMAEKYDVSEVCYIDTAGIITFANASEYIGYNMAKNKQSAEFLVLNKGTKEYVQEYQPSGYDSSQNRKFGGIALDRGGFLQVGYDAERFGRDMTEQMSYISHNRHVGENGAVVICDENGKIIADSHVMTEDDLDTALLRVISGNPNVCVSTLIGDKEYYCMYDNAEGYRIVAFMPQADALYFRNMSVYVSSFMQIIIFAVLFFLVYMMIKKLIVENIHKINTDLSKITSGNLNVSVNVRSNSEFASLSDDINSTVDTLKKYIAEASARIDKELEVARTIQLSTLPVDFPNDSEKAGFDLYAQIDTAKEVGGDFYDFYMMDSENVVIVIADVSGKGISAAMFMMRAKSIIKSLTETESDAAKILTAANERLCDHNEAEMFVTAWLGILNLKSGVLSFANAGHNPPVIRKSSGRCKFLKTRPGFVLAGMEDIRYRLNEVNLEHGDTICLYTDGITEAETTEHQLYGDERLLKCIAESKVYSAKALCAEIKTDVGKFVGNADQFDDMTMLVLKYKAYPTRKTEVEANKDNWEKVREFVHSVLEPADVSKTVIMKTELAAEEIFVNIASYAYPDSKGIAEISCCICGGVLEIAFSDNGIPYNPLDKSDPDITLSSEERGIGGLGIFMVKKYMDDVSYTYAGGRNILTLKKRLN